MAGSGPGSTGEDGLDRAVRRVVARALAEDLGRDGDVTSLATVPPGTRGRARILTRDPGVVAGLRPCLATFAQVDGRIEVTAHATDGDEVDAGAGLVELEGPLRTILTAERTALNLLGHLSGVATLTRAFVDAVAETGCVVRDTRKTTPGLRLLEKEAVRSGGGHNHRLRLDTALLVKENHVTGADGVAAAASAALERAGDRPVQVEVETLDQLEEVLTTGVEQVLLDNFSPRQCRAAVDRAGGRVRLEASGSITLENVRAYAGSGVDSVAVGALTHAAPWLDVSLEVVSRERPEILRMPATGSADATSPPAEEPEPSADGSADAATEPGPPPPAPRPATEGAGATGPDDTGSDDTGPDDTGPDDTGADDAEELLFGDAPVTRRGREE